MLRPSKIIGIGQNYRAHAAEMGKGIPEEPLMFLKPPTAVIADGAPIERPAGYERVDYEGELGVVRAGALADLLVVGATRSPTSVCWRGRAKRWRSSCVEGPSCSAEASDRAMVGVESGRCQNELVT